MKNKSLLIASVLVATASTVSAQDLTSKKGEPFLPEAGDWAISVDAVPFLNYFGRMFSNAGATSPSFGYANAHPWAIRGKMYTDATTAFRGGLRLGFGSQSYSNMVAAPQASTATAPDFPTQPNEVEDTYKAGYNGIVLSGGIEMRKGKTRLQGYYGGELIIGFGGTKDAYTYGNTITTGATPDPNIDATNSTDWSTYTLNGVPAGLPANMTTDYAGNDARITERKSSSMSIGLRGFIGVEYFLFPKISVGAEYGWGLGFSSQKWTTSYESQGVVASSGNYAVGSFTDEVKTSGFRIDSDIQNIPTGLFGGSGNLNIIFHF